MSLRILITGAGTGIGAQTARYLAPGNDIIVHYHRSLKGAEQVAEDVLAAGGRAQLVQTDLSQEIGCQSLVETIAHKGLDVLINNSGGLVKRQPADALDWTWMEQTFRLNTFSAIKLSSLCVPLLRQSKQGNIIMMTSIAARTGAPTATLYGASKGALDSFTRGLATELAPAIRVNAIAPGIIDTAFHDHISTPEKMDQWRNTTPLQQHGKAIDVAKAAEFIINNNFITGETIDINGGLFMR